MSHGDQLSQIPSDFRVIGKTNTAPYAAIAHKTKPFWGIQFHPEVTHSLRGREVISRFVLDITKCQSNWTMVIYPSSPTKLEIYVLSAPHSFLGNFHRQGNRADQGYMW